MIAVLAIVFLITVVIFVLSQSLTISSSNIADSKQQQDGVTTLILAESGLERALRAMTDAARSGDVTNGDCTGIAGGGDNSLGGGTFRISQATSTPALCGGTNPACANCVVEAVGTYGSASRKISLNLALGLQNGTFGFGGTTNSSPPGITLAVRYPDANRGAVVFNLAWRRQGSDGQTVVSGNQADGIQCADTPCGISWNIESSAGNPSVGSMGVARSVDPGFSAAITQWLTLERNYVEVGAIFTGATSGGIQKMGSYWNDQGGAGGGNSTTGGTGVSNGETNDGALTPPPGTPVVDETDAPMQTSTNWCTEADTLVAGFSGRSTSPDTLSSFTFGPGARPLAPIARLAHPAGDIYSEVWYTYNASYFSSVPQMASSYPSMVKGTIGAAFTASVPNNSNQMTVAAGVSGFLSPGDTVLGTNRLPAGTTIVSGPSSGKNGVYTLSNNATQPVNNAALTVASTNLIPNRSSSDTPDPVAGIVVGSAFVANQAIQGSGVVAGTTLVSGPDGNGIYVISSAQTVSSVTAITQGASGTTISVPATETALPPRTNPATAVAVHSGTGAFAAGTTVTALGTNSFQVSSAPITPLAGATICAGICAFFDHTPGAMTPFSIVKGAGTTQWATGFSCLKGASGNQAPRPVTTVKVLPTIWAELF